MSDLIMLSKNFSSKELNCKCCDKNGIDEDALQLLQKVRDQIGALRINSAYRCTKHNSDVGGGTRSMHLEGKAFDVSTRNWTAEKKMALVETAAAVGFTGFGYYDTFLHIDTGPERFWGEPWSMNDGNIN